MDNEQNKLNEKLLSYAWNGDVIAVMELLECGADIKAEDKYGSTALHLAAEKGHIEVVKILLEYGADSKVTSKSEYTPLMLAVITGHDAVIDVFHAAGKFDNINAQDRDGWTALHMAVCLNRNAAFKKLLEYGADIRTCNKYGFRPMIHAEGEIKEILEEHEARLEAESSLILAHAHMMQKYLSRIFSTE